MNGKHYLKHTGNYLMNGEHYLRYAVYNKIHLIRMWCMESLERILGYPTRRDNWLMTVLIGGVLVLLGFLVVPLILVYGYVVRVIRETHEDQPEPPVFEEWEQLLVDGLKAVAIGIVYMLIPGLVAALTIGSALASFATGGNVGATAAGLVFGLTVSTILALAFGYVATAALVNFVREDRLGAAFDFTVLRQVIFHRDYAIPWLIALLVFVVAGVIGSIPAIGWILTPFVTFYAMTVAGNLWSSGVSAALDSTDSPEHFTGEQPAS